MGKNLEGVRGSGEMREKRTGARGMVLWLRACSALVENLFDSQLLCPVADNHL